MLHELNWWKFLVIETFSACLQQPVTTNALDDGWGATYPSWFILPPTQDFEAVTVCTENENDFKCYISENYENTLKFGHFLHVYNNQSLEMPWMMGGGQPIPAGLSYPPPMIFEHWLAMILLLLLIALTTINGFVSQNTDTAC